MNREATFTASSSKAIEGYDLELDEYVAEFERRRITNPQASFRDILPPHGHPRRNEVLLELIRVDMELSWESGVERFLEDYAIDYPALFQDTLVLRQLIREEMRLRRAAGEDPNLAEYAERFECLASDPSWSPRDCSTNCSESLDREPKVSATARMPRVGDVVRHFELAAELGAGSFARVFLARQLDLSHRLVVVKVASRFPGEAGTLAKLQHTNIVPIYSVHQHGRFHLVCMPYLGSCTLSDFLADLRSGDAPPSGKSVASTLHQRMSRTWLEADSRLFPKEAGQEASPKTQRTTANAQLLSRLAELSYEQFVLGLAADLAAGLQHAHERGILHRDIKPANILLTDDGRPMLLDFNLSTNRDEPVSNELGVGGTLRYMSPEALRQAVEPQFPTDARSDIYALGVVLSELLGSTTPFPDRTGDWKTAIHQMIADREAVPLSPVEVSKQVSPAVFSIVMKSLAPNPQNRYQTASELEEDLRRQLANLPLKHAPDRSFSERFQKWVKRHPRLTSGASVSVAAGALLVSLLLILYAARSRINRLENDRQIRLTQNQLNEVRALLAGSSESTRELDAGLQRCEDALSILDTISPSHSESDIGRQLRFIRGELLLHKAKGLEARASRALDAKRQAAELAVSYEVHQAAETLLSQGPLHVQWLAQEVELLSIQQKPVELALKDLLEAIEQNGIDLSSPSNGKAYTATALEALRNQCSLKAADPDYWLARGKMEAELKQTLEAQSSLRLAMELAPKSPWPAYHAGLLELDEGRFAQAKRFFDRVIELAPEEFDAYFNRAIARLKLGDPQGAIADLHQVELRTQEIPRLYFVREMAKRNLRDDLGAEADLKKGLALMPTDALSWNARGEARLRSTPLDPQGALSDFSKAIELDPLLRQAYENKAHVLSEVLGEAEKAIQALDDAVNRFPDYALARSSRAVLFARAGKKPQAREDAEKSLTQERSPIICYQVACVLLLTNPNPEEEARAMALLKETVRKEPQLADLMPTDQDLASVRNSPSFRSTIDSINQLR